MLSRIIATLSGSTNCARNDSIERAVVSEASAGRRSTRIGLSPARARKKAVAAPMIPPPMMIASAVDGKSGSREATVSAIA